MLAWTITRNDVTSVNVEPGDTRGARARIFPRATSECAGSMLERARARYHNETIEHRGSGAGRDSVRPGVRPSLVPIQVREIPFSGPASLPDASRTKPVKNSPPSQCVRTTVVLDAFGAVIRTSRRDGRPDALNRGCVRQAGGCDAKPVPFRHHTHARGRAGPTMSLGRKPEAPGEPQSRIARRQLQLPRARALAGIATASDMDVRGSVALAGTTYEFLMPPPSSWGVHCAC